MKKIGLLCLALCCLLAFLLPTVSVAAEGEGIGQAALQGCHSIDAQVPLLGTAQIIENAKAVILFEANSETLMYAWNADEQLSPASLVKIMTALIAVERGTMSDIVTVKKAVLDSVSYDAVSADLQENEIMTLEDLLYCMLVGSANDAAAVIADHIGGSQAAFVTEMNLYAQSLGCTGTQFMNAHGLHHEQQYTTARDAARILAAAMKNEQFKTIFNTVSYTVEATNKSEARQLSSVNFLVNRDEYEIYYDERVTGGRTGEANNGDRCVAAVSEANGLQMISVIMGARSVYEADGSVRSLGGFVETSDLLDKGFDGYQVAQVLYANQALTQQSVLNGSCDVVLGPQISVSTVLPADADVKSLSYRFSETGALQAPIKKGQNISSVEVWHGDSCIAYAELFAMNEVSVMQPQTQTVESPDDGEGQWTTVLLVVGILLAVIVIFIFGVRMAAKLRKAAANNRSRRYRRSRRRSR